MYALMAFETATMLKASWTLLTFEHFLRIVNFLVSFKTSTFSKAFITNVTFEWFFTRMGKLMSFESYQA